MDKARPDAFDRVRDAAEKIAGLMDRLDPAMTAMCRTTCPDCRDNCCARATIWYDFKDLLFLYFSRRPLPDRQIERPAGICTQLTAGGCALKRMQRPFVCTWYLCGAQKRMPGAERVEADLLKIQVLRRDMENCFCGNCL